MYSVGICCSTFTFKWKLKPFRLWHFVEKSDIKYQFKFREAVQWSSKHTINWMFIEMIKNAFKLESKQWKFHVDAADCYLLRSCCWSDPESAAAAAHHHSQTSAWGQAAGGWAGYGEAGLLCVLHTEEGDRGGGMGEWINEAMSEGNEKGEWWKQRYNERTSREDNHSLDMEKKKE